MAGRKKLLQGATRRAPPNHWQLGRLNRQVPGWVVLQGAQGCSQWLTRASQRFGRLYDIGCSADNSLEVPAA